MVHKPGFSKTHSLFLRNGAATNIRITSLWNVTSCSPLERNNFRENPLPQTSNLNKFYRNVFTYLQNRMMSSVTSINFEPSRSIKCAEFLDQSSWRGLSGRTLLPAVWPLKYCAWLWHVARDTWRALRTECYKMERLWLHTVGLRSSYFIYRNGNGGKARRALTR